MTLDTTSARSYCTSRTGKNKVLAENQLLKAQVKITHLQTDLKLKTGTWKTEREGRIEFEARTVEAEKHVQQLRVDMQKRLTEK